MLSEAEKGALLGDQPAWIIVTNCEEEQTFEGTFVDFVDEGKGQPGYYVIQERTGNVLHMSGWSLKLPKDFKKEKLVGSVIRFKRKGSKMHIVTVRDSW